VHPIVINIFDFFVVLSASGFRITITEGVNSSSRARSFLCGLKKWLSGDQVSSLRPRSSGSLLPACFCAATIAKKDGKDHRYFSITENHRIASDKTVQRTVLYLGEINDQQQAAWRKRLSVFDEQEQEYANLSLFPFVRSLESRMPISTRRLAARACSLSLGTRGLDLPKPSIVMIVGEIPACTRSRGRLRRDVGTVADCTSACRYRPCIRRQQT
jgi:hypothetical protein